MPLSAQLVDHFQNPRNSGTLTSPPAVCVDTSNPACGDTLRLSVLLDGATIVDARFQVRGCTASIAAGSALTTLLIGRTSEQLRTFQAAEVEAELGVLEPASKHAAVLCADAVKALLRLL